jgi:ribonuclease R
LTAKKSSGCSSLKSGSRVGMLSVHPRGFGFVTTEEPGPDVFVTPPSLQGALDGDRVRVRFSPSARGLDGQVVEVLERNAHYVGGTLRVATGAAFVEPDDQRLGAHRVRVVGKLPPGAGAGKRVIARIVGFASRPGEPFLANVIESFDQARLGELELRRILLSQKVRERFPSEVLSEIRALPGEVTRAERQGRTDLRKVELVTIDPTAARDHDDAVWAERLPDGGYRVLVAIADVSHYVRPGTALDREALARGCTIYLPSRAIPMLPTELSGELASLVPNRDRLAMAVEVGLDAHGKVRTHRFLECVMRSAARLSYQGVARALGLTTAPARQPAAERRRPLLEVLLEVARLRGARRKSRGGLDFDLPEARVKLDPATGQPLDIERSRKDPGEQVAYNLVEELMLLANEVVARELSARKVAAIYRVHGAPSELKAQEFCRLAGSLGYHLDEAAAQDLGQLARFLSGAAGTPHAKVLSFLLLRAMQQATYSTENTGHFGLATKDYLHFTSPIRRYPDLAVQRLVRKIVRGQTIRARKRGSGLDEQAAESSRLERRAMLVEREAVDMYRALLMRDRLGETFTATITGITERGFYAAIDAPFVEVLCGINSLPRDHYRADPFGTRLFGLHSGTSYALFDRVEVRIADVSIARRKISAVPVGGSRATRPTRAGQGDGGENRHRKRKKHPERETKAADRRLSDRTEDRKKRREAHPRPSR